MRMREIEKENQEHVKKQEKKIKDLENKCKQKTTKEKDSVNQEEATIRCGQCAFTTTSKQVLKIHKTRVNSKINFEEFPASCDICEKVLENEKKKK
jgi:hypothetical protein